MVYTVHRFRPLVLRRASIDKNILIKKNSLKYKPRLHKQSNFGTFSNFLGHFSAKASKGTCLWTNPNEDIYSLTNQKGTLKRDAVY